MGRHPWSTRLTVEQCRCLDVAAMARDGVFASPSGSRWMAVWRDRAGKPEEVLTYSVIARNRVVVGLEVNSHQTGKYSVEIATTCPPFGGVRYWFRCPLGNNSVACGRLVGRLYLPPGQAVFGCRLCYGLTYESTQRHDSRVDRLRKLPPGELAVLLATSNPTWHRLGLTALARRTAKGVEH
jgi:hypothetical protein